MTPPMPATGSVLGDRYVVGGLLGKGGMARVYAARDRKLQREVAVKVILAESPDRDALRRFSREALATSAVQHPNVVAVFDAGEDAGRPYLVTELLHGSTLRALLQDGPLEVAVALRYARQIAAGLAAAHDKGFTHRDLKPENIFITEDGWAKILDFGLVKLNEDLHAAPMPDGSSTAGGRTLGTVGYMAPEQVRGQAVDARADIFNFGLVLYEMLAGERAFNGTTSTEMGYAILFDEAKPLPGSVPRWLRLLVEQCLSKDREARPSSAREVFEALQQRGAIKKTKRAWRIPASVPIVLLLIAAAAAVASLRVPWSKLGATPAPPPPGLTGVKPAGSVAFFPFDASGAPEFASLAEGVSDLLGRDLEGGQLHALETASVLKVFGSGKAGDLDRARLAAQQLGARYFVLGRIEEKKGKLQVEAVLHETDSTNAVTRGFGLGPPSDVLTVMRKLSDGLQGLSPTPSEFKKKLELLAWHTSYSVAALQGWLDGERFYRQLDYDKSNDAFRRAVTADTEFALAHYRLGLGTQIIQPLAAEGSFELAVRYKDRLRPSEQLLAQGELALQRGLFADADAYFLDATHKFPGEGETWRALGEYYFHHGPARGHSPQDALMPLTRALMFDPVDTEAICHLSDLALLRGERDTVASLTDRLLLLSDDPLMLAMVLRDAWAHNDQALHDKAMASIDRLNVATGKQALYLAFNTLSWLMGAPADQDLIAGKFKDRDGFQLGAITHLLHGEPEAAREIFRRASTRNPSGDTPFHALWVDSLSEFEITPAELAADRAEAERLLAAHGGNPDKLPMLRYVSGVLAVRAKDLAAATAIASELEKMTLGNSSIPEDLALALRARILQRQKNYAGALALLEKQNLRIPLRYEMHYAYWKTGEWFLRAELLEALGRPQEALPLYDALIFASFSDPIFGPIAHLHKARIYAATGDVSRAIEHYKGFTDAWKNCEGAEKPLVQAAERELTRLMGTVAAK
ncbi:MAG TPA: protein kinase [Myxococcales bacterium]